MKPAPEQPYGIEVYEADGLFLKQMIIPRARTFVPQHSHAYEHLTMLVRGAVNVWKDGVFDRRYEAPAGILIAAGVKHLFRSLLDNTELWCIHNLHNEAVVKVLEEHQLVEAK